MNLTTRDHPKADPGSNDHAVRLAITWAVGRTPIP
jgi:hypothetical protein